MRDKIYIDKKYFFFTFAVFFGRFLYFYSQSLMKK